MVPRPVAPYHAGVADLSYLRDQLLQLSVRDALQLVGMMLQQTGVRVGADGSGAQSFDVVLTSYGANKISIIKVLRELTGLGLKEAKDMAESVPQVVLRRQSRDTAEAARMKLLEVGGTVDLQPFE